MNFASILEDGARRWPDEVAVASGERALTYSQLNDEANRLANVLEREFGVAAGDRVGTLLHNSPEVLVACFACGKLGAAYVPCNPDYTVSELKGIFGHCRPAVLLCSEETAGLAARVRDVLERPPLVAEMSGAGEGAARLRDALRRAPDENLGRDFDADHPAGLFYTSGTTSQAKGAIWTHGCVFGGREVVERLEDLLGPDDIVLPYIPLFHAWALIIYVRVMIAGASLFTLRLGTPFGKLLEVVAARRVTYLITNPTFYHLIVRHRPAAARAALATLRAAQSAASPLDPEVLVAFEREFGIPLIESYGMTETGYICTNRLSEPRVPGSVGRAAPLTEVRIIDEAGWEVPACENGQIVMRGPNLMTGFYENPADPPFTQDGWFLTGDIGRMDAVGNVYISGRVKEMIDVHGEKVYSVEVEQVLRNHPKVADAAVFGLKSARKEFPAACIIARDGAGQADAAEILDFCRDRLAPFKVPRQLFFVSEFPCNSLGKVVKRRLQERFQRAGAVASEAAP
jgi:acyl-CoA synthetase (AMP-forming)/AMP-acid ligase II